MKTPVTIYVTEAWREVKTKGPEMAVKTGVKTSVKTGVKTSVETTVKTCVKTNIENVGKYQADSACFLSNV